MNSFLMEMEKGVTDILTELNFELDELERMFDRWDRYIEKIESVSNNFN
jgi:hypothetical protein